MKKTVYLGQSLTKNDLKGIVGGTRPHTYKVTCTTLPGYTMIEAGSCVGSSSQAGAAACQTASYNYCQSTPGCEACTASY